VSDESAEAGTASPDVPLAIVLGSDSDLETMTGGLRLLDGFGVRYTLQVASAHRTPDRVVKLAEGARANGVKVIIAVAGKSAHLAGVIAAHTSLPVLGVPAAGGSLGGLDALLSTVNMPGGVPVGTLGIGSTGGVNACLLATRILSIGCERLAARLQGHRADLERQTDDKNARLGQKLTALAADK
jgi:phosphoribosylaminoimidazole carboxylase PurE protein